MINTDYSQKNIHIENYSGKEFSIRPVFFTKCCIILILVLFVWVFTSIEVNARGLKPTSMGRALDKTYSPSTDVIFDGSLSHDNDSQSKQFVPRWKWDFEYDYDLCEFTVDKESYSATVSHRYTSPGTYVIGVKYIDDDGVEGDLYLFTVVVSSVKRYYYVKDHLGSIRQTIDDNGVVIEKQDYSSYGAILPGRSMNTASPNEKYKFTEKERDKESGLDYFGARYYDSEIGRWLSVDPLADKYPGWSPYNYCVNNPLKFIDPDGQGIVPGTPIEPGTSSDAVKWKITEKKLAMSKEGRELLSFYEKLPYEVKLYYNSLALKTLGQIDITFFFSQNVQTGKITYNKAIINRIDLDDSQEGYDEVATPAEELSHGKDATKHPDTYYKNKQNAKSYETNQNEKDGKKNAQKVKEEYEKAQDENKKNGSN